MKWIVLLAAIPLVAWTVGQACGARQPALSPEQARGRVLYEQYCAQCHGGAQGGQLRDIPPPHNANGHTWHHPDGQLIQITRDGLPLAAPGQPQMPAFKDKLTVEEVKAILAYIKTWWTEEQREWQADVTRRYEEGLQRQPEGQR